MPERSESLPVKLIKKIRYYDVRSQREGWFNCDYAESYEDGGGELCYDCTHPKSEDRYCAGWNGDDDECPLLKGLDVYKMTGLIFNSLIKIDIFNPSLLPLTPRWVRIRANVKAGSEKEAISIVKRIYPEIRNIKRRN